MGRLYFPDQVFDANGDPMSGAKLYTYDATATTTPKATYTTNALSTAHANPIVADSAGRFADAFAETGESFYAVLKTSADVTVAAWENVEALGESATDNITRTFTASRYKVSSGTVDGVNDGTLVEYGSLSPTNTGGYVKEGGWAGSQGTYKKIDFAAVALTGTLTATGNATVGGNLTVSGTGASSVGGAFNTGGTITENAKDIPGVVYTDLTTFAAASSLEITLPNSPTGVTAWKIYFTEFQLSASATLTATMSFDGTNYKTGAADYTWAYHLAQGSVINGRDDADSSIRLMFGEVGNGKIGTMEIMVQTTETNGDPTLLFGHYNHWHYNGGVFYAGIGHFNGIYIGGSTSRVMKIKLTPASGTLTGKYMLIPLRGTGN